MADERYQWLDQEAAERLLRGEPVDAADDHVRGQAERLSEALGAARTPAAFPAADAELPGEAAALAAFRAATAARAAAVTAGADDRADLGRVRLAPVTAPARRWGRSLRYGLAAAVAAVTVGGVAVAAGTGVLSIGGPAPASSVTAGESPDPLVSKEPGMSRDPETPPQGPGGSDGTSGSSPSADAATTAPATRGPDGDGASTPTPGRTTPDTGTDTGIGGKDDTGGKDGTSGTDLRTKMLKACQDYRAGRLDSAGREQLTRNLRTGDTLRRYCDRVLAGGTGASGGTDASGGGTGEGSDGDAKDEDRGASGGDRRDSAGNDAAGSGDARSSGGDPRGGTRSTAAVVTGSTSGTTSGTVPGTIAEAPVPLPV
ncbi:MULTISPECIES: hypothetical protein [Streptomyces]|uniref:hypothetical protein n=1 Tax=Streptomyces TaxID=1883 RepID=UPI00068C0AE2|nr:MULTISPECIES: hypothetical protein [Streptomyces]